LGHKWIQAFVARVKINIYLIVNVLVCLEGSVQVLLAAGPCPNPFSSEVVASLSQADGDDKESASGLFKFKT